MEQIMVVEGGVSGVRGQMTEHPLVASGYFTYAEACKLDQMYHELHAAKGNTYTQEDFYQHMIGIRIREMAVTGRVVIEDERVPKMHHNYVGVRNKKIGLVAADPISMPIEIRNYAPKLHGVGCRKPNSGLRIGGYKFRGR